MKKLIGFAKIHKFDEQQDVFIADRDRKKWSQSSETSQSHPYAKVMFEEPDDGSDRQVCKIAKAVAHALKNDTEDDPGDGTDTGKSKSGAGATFGNKGSNQYGGSRR